MGQDRPQGLGRPATGHLGPDHLRRRTCGLTTSPRTSCCCWPICAGYVGGPDEGAVVGFAAGLLSDLFLQNTPFGLSALAGCLAGFAAGWARTNFLRLRLWLAPAIAAAGTALGVVLFVVIGYLVGPGAAGCARAEDGLVEVVVIEATYAALFALPAAGLMYWALGARTRRPQPLTSRHARSRF